MRRGVFIALGLVVLLVLAGATYAFEAAITDRGTPTVDDVREIALGPMPDAPKVAKVRKIDGVGFPDWSRWGWKSTGGRVDPLGDDRQTATLVYRKGSDRIAYTIVAGTGNVDELRPAREVKRQPAGKPVFLTLVGAAAFSPDKWGGGQSDEDRAAIQLKRKRKGRTVVLTAWPTSTRLWKAFQDMAVRPAA